MMMILATVLLLSAGQVLGHGFVETLTIAGKSYPGNPPAESNKYSPSVIRQILNTQPIKGTDNPFLACGTGAKAAELVADANPGDVVGFKWEGAGGTPWPHVLGPIITYIASCGSVTCDKYDPKNAKWFKISELAQKSDNTWYMADVHAGQSIEVKIPATLAPGDYLIRQELIALHIAMTLGGVEFYASCSQLRVGGSQTGQPDPSDLVSLPGAYDANHPGLFTPEIFQPGFKYVMPGPPVARIASGGSGGKIVQKPTSATTTKKNNTKGSSTAVDVPSSTSKAPAATTAVAVDIPGPVANVAPIPVATTASTRRCKRKSSSTELKAKRTSPTPVSRSHHFRRALGRVDHDFSRF